MALLRRAYVNIEEVENGAVEYAHLFVGIFCGDDFYGQNLSFTNLVNKNQMVRIPAKDLKDITSEISTIIADPFPSLSIETTAHPEKDNRISVVNKHEVPEIIVYSVESAAKMHYKLLQSAIAS